mmetsp:Transcript_31/g.103  ORF Transcript_31/g.103 Transcript_31/m.103 type:complete len:206 (+) Transcript_31:174-791(+)
MQEPISQLASPWHLRHGRGGRASLRRARAGPWAALQLPRAGRHRSHAVRRRRVAGDCRRIAAEAPPPRGRQLRSNSRAVTSNPCMQQARMLRKPFEHWIPDDFLWHGGKKFSLDGCKASTASATRRKPTTASATRRANSKQATSNKLSSMHASSIIVALALLWSTYDGCDPASNNGNGPWCVVEGDDCGTAFPWWSVGSGNWDYC